MIAAGQQYLFPVETKPARKARRKTVARKPAPMVALVQPPGGPVEAPAAQPMPASVEPAIEATAPAVVPADVVGQVKAAFAPGARLAACFGLALGGAIPWLTFRTAHADGFGWWSLAAAFVLGGLLYSGPTVWQWIRTFKGAVPAFGFVVLLEGLMVTSSDPVVTYAALAMLIFINAISTACALSLGAK